MKKILLIIGIMILTLALISLSNKDINPEIHWKIKIKEVFSGIITRDKDDRVYSGQIKSEAGFADFQKTYGVNLNDLKLDFKKQMLIFGITDDISTRAFQLLNNIQLNSFTLDYADTGIMYKLRAAEEGKKHSHIQVFVMKKTNGISHIKVKNLIRNGLSKVYGK